MTGATATSTPIINLPATSTQAVSVVPTSTSVPSGSRPSTYTLKNGEFPYCIARRFQCGPGSAAFPKRPYQRPGRQPFSRDGSDNPAKRCLPR
ncbi:MAG: hypothetical protein MZV64_19010 [Ignavibacteriales bacterium]|nr:hypothetical protein [Ignavibacteriales bacterium]